MADYKIEVTEYHVVNKTYWVEAQNQKEARSKAKQRDWYNASGDDYTGDISKVTIHNVVKEVV